MRNKSFLAVLLVLAITGVTVGWFAYRERPVGPAVSGQTPSLAEAGYVGRQICAGCHAEQDQLWRGSHHDLAMQEANEGTVFGDFRDAEFRKDGVVSRFFRKDGRFLVNTDGLDGQLADFEIKYTFGFTPLQQYLVEFRAGGSRPFPLPGTAGPGSPGGAPHQAGRHRRRGRRSRPSHPYRRALLRGAPPRRHRHADP